MKLAAVALLLTLTATTLAQAQAPAPVPPQTIATPFQPPHPTTPFTDPANLRGERPTPRTGRELPIDQGTLGLQQLLRKLNTRASLMLIVAHPDDEDGGMLTLYSRGLGARVADLALNRGEGGQNAMTGDFEDALGLIRTQELLSADRYFDATQMFGTEVDFGFSKTKQESFAKWGHQRVLYDVVRAIRLYRPLVIASVFIGGVTDGHGQHQVAGQIAQEAFLAAADPTIFPELTAEGILPWAPLKVYARVPRQAITAQGLFDYATGQYTPARFTNYVTGAVTTTLPSTDVIIHEGLTDPLLTTCAANPTDLPATMLSSRPERSAVERPAAPASASPADCRPLSYVQFARIGLGLQRSQIGPGMRLPPPGAFDIAYHLYGSRLCNAPTDARIPDSPVSSSPTNCHPERSEGPAVPPFPTTLSSRPERSVVERPAAPPADALAPEASSLESQPTFFTGIDTSLTGIADLAPSAPPFLRFQLSRMAAKIAEATHHFNPNDPAAAAPPLAAALQTCNALIGLVSSVSLDNIEKANVLHELRIKRVQLNDALALALGLTFDATSTGGADSIALQPVSVWAQLHSHSASPLQIEKVWLTTSQGDVPPKTAGREQTPDLTADLPSTRTLTATSAYTIDITRPYFFRDSIESPIYQLRVPDLRNAPQTPPAITSWATVNYRGTDIELAHVVHDGPQPISLVPADSVAFSRHAGIIPLTDHAPLAWVESRVPLGKCIAPANDTPYCARFSGESAIHLHLPTGWKIQDSTEALKPVGASLTQYAGFTLTPPLLHAGDHLEASASATLDAQDFREGYRVVGYPGIVTTNFYTPAIYRANAVDLKFTPDMPVGYIEGTGDETFDSLFALLGGHIQTLTVADLTPANLARFKAVVLGVRAYNAHPDLHGAPTQALLDYAKNGGNVLVQYQTDEFTAADAPYPLTLGRAAEKVVDETAPVKLLQPDNPLLTTPNRITSADFDNWIEERGHGFLHTWDPRYTALTETHDPGGPDTQPQAPQLGGLITTPLGRGRWTYCAFALYRQLPEAVPGAFRLFVNLLTPGPQQK